MWSSTGPLYLLKGSKLIPPTELPNPLAMVADSTLFRNMGGINRPVFGDPITDHTVALPFCVTHSSSSGSVLQLSIPHSSQLIVFPPLFQVLLQFFEEQRLVLPMLGFVHRFQSFPSLQPRDLIDGPFASPTRNQSVHSVSTEHFSASRAFVYFIRHQYVV